MRNNLLSSSIAVLMALIVCKFTAFIQEMVIAAYLGATAVGDSFNILGGIHDIIYPMLAVGISQVFFPAYKKILVQNNQRKSDSLASYAIVFFTAISMLVVTLLIIFAPFVVSVVAPGFEPSQKELTAYLVRLSAASYIFVCCASVLSSILIAQGQFFISEIRGAFTHLSVIIFTVFFYKSYGVSALAVSLVVAGLARLAILLPFVRRGFSFTLRDSLQWSYIKLLLSRIPSAMVSSGITQLNTLVDKIMASTLATGSISCLSYGSKLYMVLQELFANVIATSSYPQIVELIAQNKKDELANLLSKIVVVIWFFTIPLTVGGIFYSNSLVDVVFVRGVFTAEMGSVTANVFVGYILALAFSSLNGVVNNVYFGFGDTRSPMLFNLLNLVLNIVLNFIFIREFAVMGLAIATSISSLICLLTRVLLLRKKMPLQFEGIFRQGTLILVVSVFVVIFSFGIVSVLPIKSSFLLLFVGVVLSVCMYMFGMKLMHFPVYDEAMCVIMKFVGKLKK